MENILTVQAFHLVSVLNVLRIYSENKYNTLKTNNENLPDYL